MHTSFKEPFGGFFADCFERVSFVIDLFMFLHCIAHP